MNRLLQQLGLLAVVFLVVLALVGGLMSYNQVPEGQVGIEKKWGATTGDAYQPGPHFVRPLAVSVVELPVRPQSYTMSATKGEGNKQGSDAVEVLTKNGVEVAVDITVRYRLNENQSVNFYEQWGSMQQVENRLIRPTVRAQLRTRGGAIPTSEIYTASGQEKLRQSVTKVLKEEFGDESLVLEEVQIRRIRLPGEYQRAVNEKEIRKQEVQKKQYAIEESRKEAERKRIEARGQADANRILASSLTDEVLTSKKIKAIRNSEGDVIYIPTNEGGLIRTVDVGANSSDTAGSGSGPGSEPEPGSAPGPGSGAASAGNTTNASAGG